MANDRWKLRKEEGKVYGPVDTETIRKWIEEGRISPEDYLSREDKEEWVKAKSLPQFWGLFRVTPSKGTYARDEKVSSGSTGLNHCPNCGKKIDTGIRFCLSCGNPIAAFRKEKKDKTFSVKSKNKVSKAKIIIGFITIPIVIILVINGYISMVAERELDKEISRLRREILLPFAIGYSDISVNALLGKISFSNITVSDTYKTVELACDALKLNLAYSDIIDLVKKGKVDDINSFAIVFNNLSLESPVGNIRIEEFGIKFDGHISKEIIENGLREFPNEPQKLKVFFKGAKIQIPELYQGLALSNTLQEKVSTIGNFSLKLTYNPHPKKIIGKVKSATPIISFNFTGSLRYMGNNLEDFKVEEGSSNLRLKIIPDGLQWGRSNVTGRYSLSKILMELTLDYKYSPQLGYILPTKGSLNFLIEDLNVEFSGSLKQELEESEFGQIMGIDMNKFSLDKLSIHCKYARNQLKVFDTGLFTPFLKVVLDAQIKIDEENIGESVIENASFTITPLTKDMENLLVRLQNDLGQTFPWKEGSVVFEITGRFRDPKIKGYELSPGPFSSEFKRQPAPKTVILHRTKQAKKASCLSNLKQIGLALHMYAVDWEGRFPECLSAIFPLYVADPSVLICPSTGISIPERITRDNVNLAYEYIPGLNSEMPSDIIVVYDRAGNHQGGRNVLFVDGRVRWIPDEAWAAAYQRSRELLRRYRD